MKHIVILTGAGMSAESGISTFRDSDGLWENHRIEDVASPEGFRKNPQLVLGFYNQRRKQLLEVNPNEGHKIIAELERNYKVSIITQNVDDLHERAGSSSTLHLHGELMKIESTANPRDIRTLTAENIEINIGDLDEQGYQLRPHIVWFGEAVPMIEKAVDVVRKADIMVIIGTSLNVYPAARLLDFSPMRTPTFLIDPKSVAVKRVGIHHIQKGASEGMKELVEILKTIQ